MIDRANRTTTLTPGLAARATRRVAALAALALAAGACGDEPARGPVATAGEALTASPAPAAPPSAEAVARAEALAELAAQARATGGRVPGDALRRALGVTAPAGGGLDSAPPAAGAPPASPPARRAALDALQRLRERDPALEITWSARRAAPSYLAGRLTAPDAREPEAIARDLLPDVAAAFRVPADQLVLDDARTRASALTGHAHLWLQQTLGGYPVHRRGLKVHVAPDGAVTAVHGDVEPGLDAAALPSRPRLTAADVEAAVRALYGVDGDFDVFEGPELRVVVDRGAPALVWHASVLADGMVATTEVDLDAVTGEVRDERVLFEELTGSGCDPYGNNLTLQVTKKLLGDYQLKDTTRPTNVRGYDQNGSTTWTTADPWTDGNNVWCGAAQEGPVAGHDNMGKVLDYFDSVHGRNGYDDRGGDIKMGFDALYNVSGGGTSPSNAASIGSGRFTFGEGGAGELPWTTLDVVGHELTHALLNEVGIDSTNGTTGGAIHEHMGDVFGTLVEWQFGNASGAANFTMGEEIFTNGVTVVRDLANPGADRDHVAEYDATLSDHRNSQMLSYAFYLLWVGGTHPQSGVVVPAIGRSAVRDVYYEGVTAWLSLGNPSFLDLRSALASAASALFGSGSAEHEAVKAAFTAIGVTTKNMGLIPWADDYDTWTSWSPVTFGSAWSSPGVGYTSTTLEDGTPSDGEQLGLTPDSGFLGHVRGELLLTLPPLEVSISGAVVTFLEPHLEIEVGFPLNGLASDEALVYVTFMPADGSTGYVWSRTVARDGALDTDDVDLSAWAGVTGTLHVQAYQTGSVPSDPVIFDTLKITHK